MKSLITAVREHDEAARFLAWPGDFDRTEETMSRMFVSTSLGSTARIGSGSMA
jgi:hypothetical protein